MRTLIGKEIAQFERKAARNQRETENELELEEAEGQQEGDDGEYEAEHRTEESENIFGPESGYEDGFIYIPGQGFRGLDERQHRRSWIGERWNFRDEKKLILKAIWQKMK
jgi:hypothetical protein